MPLSKEKQAEYQRERRKGLRGVIPSVIPKLPWYAGIHNHFGEVWDRRYAKEFFNSLGETNND